MWISDTGYAQRELKRKLLRSNFIFSYDSNLVNSCTEAVTTIWLLLWDRQALKKLMGQEPVKCIFSSCKLEFIQQEVQHFTLTWRRPVLDVACHMYYRIVISICWGSECVTLSHTERMIGCHWIHLHVTHLHTTDVTTSRTHA